MLNAIARAAQALAIWRAAEAAEIADDDDTSLSSADTKAAIAKAYEQFIQAAYDIGFDLVPRLLQHGEITSQHEVRYSAVAGGGGLILQKMNLEPGNPGIMLIPGQAPTNCFLQLMIDLPELLEILEVTV